MDDVLPRSEINHDARLLAAHKLLLLRSLLSGSSEQDTGEGAYGFQTTLPAVSLSNKYSHWPLSPQCEVFRLHCMPPFIAMQSNGISTGVLLPYVSQEQSQGRR